jgi:integrase
LAQRFGKPKSDVDKEDWERANSWKWPSLIWTALDAGLRPKEVSQTKVSWVDAKNALLRIPPEDAVKNNEYWTVGLQARTAKILDNWLDERECYEKYEDSDLLWLTKYGNPYKSRSLDNWFQKLCDEARIDRSNRNLSWYSIRHSVGREMVKEEGVGAAAAQLRHKSMNSTLRYIRASVEERKDALERMS